MTLKKGIYQAEKALRRRLSRRFSVIGEQYDFEVKINNKPIQIADRDYFHKIQFLWDYNGDSSDLKNLCKNLDAPVTYRSNHISGTNFRISGWIGTAKESKQLKDEGENLNRIVILMRGKLAQEDLLNELGERGIYSTYLIGEIEADFLDDDTEIDIATSSRQKLIEDDPRYQALEEFLRSELKSIQNKWSDLRDTEGTRRALEIPAVNEWFKELKGDSKKKAKSLFGKINKISSDSEEQRMTLLKHGILAFESLRYKENLDALDKLDGESLAAFTEVFQNLDDIEASFYHQIVTERIKVIDALREKVESNDLEKVVQSHLFQHLWLLDPSWERATGSEYLEQQVSTEFEKVTAKLSDAERSGRIDIKYKTPHGKHVIIELKRAGRSVTTNELIEQIDKYRRALKKTLRSMGRENETIEVICLLGKEPKDWSEPDGTQESLDTLKVKNAQIMLYQNLIDNAYKSYKSYIESRNKTGPITKLIQQLDLF